MAASRQLEVVTNEITIKGEQTIYRLVMQLVKLGIINELDLKEEADYFTCLRRLERATLQPAPALLRFVGNFFKGEQAYQFAEFFYRLSGLGLDIEIIDNKLSEASATIFEDYFFQLIQSKIKLIGYTADLVQQTLSVFSNESLGVKTLREWAGKFGVVYSVETLPQFIAMLDKLNTVYVSAAREEKFNFACVDGDRYPDHLNDFSLAYQTEETLLEAKETALTLQAEFMLGFYAVYQAYTQLHRGHQQLLDGLNASVMQLSSEPINNIVNNVFMALETLIPSSILPFFEKPFHTRMSKLNDHLDKDHCARMLGLLLQACVDFVDGAERQQALSSLRYPSHLNADLVLAYEKIREPLARLKRVTQAAHQAVNDHLFLYAARQ